MSQTKEPPLMEKIVSLCKRRGFIFQSSEIYGGINGFWDYGPLGAELRRNIRDCWWKDMVRMRDDVVGLESSIIMHPKVWEASGHVGGFNDPMCTCKFCKKLLREDHIWPMVEESDWFQSLAEMYRGSRPVTLEELKRWGETKGKKLAPNLALVRNPPVTLSWLAERIEKFLVPVETQMLEIVQHLATEQFAQTGLITPCPYCGGELTEPRQFNMMLTTNVGAMESTDSLAYLRPETAQGMFADFKAVLDTGRVKIPFGIAQVGKSFRNEITPRNFIFRSREFEQMEMEYFISDEDDWAKWHRYWIDWCRDWLIAAGIPAERLTEYQHPKEKLSHYSRGTTDLMFEFPFGVQELWGIAARGNFDLSQHAKHSGTPLEYFDDAAKRRYVPHVIEPAVGVDRIMLAILCSAYAEDQMADEKGVMETRVVLRFAPRMAPIKVAIFPLLKNKPDLVARARAVRDALRGHMNVFYDEAGGIGRRYRRQDEIGTPFCVTIDFDTLGENGPQLKDTVTLRHRDDGRQERVPIAELLGRILPQVQ
jgi:glycyl-tRNA synthetase